MQKSPLEDGRRNEIAGSLRKDTLKLYFQIERGLNVEIQVKSEAPQDDELKVQINELKSLSVKLQYPQVTGDPILSLPPGVDDDESDSKGSPSDDSNPSDSSGRKRVTKKKQSVEVAASKE